jgi:hypothetical protein
MNSATLQLSYLERVFSDSQDSVPVQFRQYRLFDIWVLADWTADSAWLLWRYYRSAAERTLSAAAYPV